MPTLAAYPGMMQRARKREGLRVCRAAWLVGVSIREYREIEAGDLEPSPGTYQRISELYGPTREPQLRLGFCEIRGSPSVVGSRARQQQSRRNGGDLASLRAWRRRSLFP
jgi:transcriptional regulator with XRE-family HTH domain